MTGENKEVDEAVPGYVDYRGATSMVFSRGGSTGGYSPFPRRPGVYMEA